MARRTPTPAQKEERPFRVAINKIRNTMDFADREFDDHVEMRMVLEIAADYVATGWYPQVVDFYEKSRGKEKDLQREIRDEVARSARSEVLRLVGREAGRELDVRTIRRIIKSAQEEGEERLNEAHEWAFKYGEWWRVRARKQNIRRGRKKRRPTTALLPWSGKPEE